MVKHTRHAFQGTSASVAGVVLLANTSLTTVFKVFLVLVLYLLVGRTARAIGPFIDETGRMLRDCVVYLRKGLRRLLA